ncbi:MAG: hypothetical protein ACYSSI_06590 [Planctomycetota bacterium]|jgi:hypothetical protein
MKSTKIAVLLVIILLTTSVVQSKEKKSSGSDARNAGCLVKVTADPSIFPLNFEIINSLLRSSAVAGKAGQEILSASYEKSCTFINVKEVESPPLRSSGRTLRPRQQSTDPLVVSGGGRRQATGLATALTSSCEQTIMFGLTIILPDDVKPAAKEFLTAVTDNLQQTLTNAYETKRMQLSRDLEITQIQQNRAQAELSNLIKKDITIEQTQPIEQNPENLFVYRQLEEIVDLPKLRPDMTFSEAIEKIKNAVSPPLKIIVMWLDLEENAQIYQTTEINMDSVSQIRLGTALNLLLESVPGGSAKLGYTVSDGVIKIAIKESLQDPLELHIYDISRFIQSPSDAKNLVDTIKSTVEADSWFDAGGEGTIKTYQGRNLIVQQSLEIHKQIQKFLQGLKVGLDIPLDTTVNEISPDTRADLLRQKQKLELEVAGLEARRSAIEKQVIVINKKINSKINSDTISTELQGIVDRRIRQLKESALDYAKEKLVKARIELAQRREHVGKTAGSKQLENFNGQLMELTINLAEQKAMLEVIRKQLTQVDEQLTASVSIDPQVAQIRIAKKAFDMADRRMNELKARLDNLQPPIVTVLGAN